MDEKLKSENMQKEGSQGREVQRSALYADYICIQTYFRMHHFVVNFQTFLRLRWQGGIDPPIENPADALLVRKLSAVEVGPAPRTASRAFCSRQR